MIKLPLTNVDIHSHIITSSIGYLTAKLTSLWWTTNTIQTYYSSIPISVKEIPIGIHSNLLCVTPNLSPTREVPLSLSYFIGVICTTATIHSVGVAV